MTKTAANPMDVYRRQKRKKEIEKNKKARISARDERVVKEKTAAEISLQIKELEKRKVKNHGEAMKLQRLQKELKLVKEAKAKQQAEQQQQLTPKYAVTANTRLLTELDDPRKSVYYDERMNPFGAPPPGKPRLYHARGGGTTMLLSEAIVPGLEQELHLEKEKEQPQYIQAYGQDGSVDVVDTAADVRKPRLQQQQQQYRQPPPPPPPRDQQFRSSQGISERIPPHNQQQQHPSYIPPPPPPPPLPQEMPPPPPPPQTENPPSLPKPSSAVARMKRKRKLAADIWASTEEVEYERTRGIDLEEGIIEDNEWYYKDSSQRVQGPYTTPQMKTWYAAGYFPHDTLVRQGNSDTFVRLATVYHHLVKHQLQHEAQYQAVGDVQDRMSALRWQQKINGERSVDDDVQARIDAVRQQERNESAGEYVRARIHSLQQHELVEPSEEKGDDDVQARIDALRRRTRDDEPVDDDVQSRIDALRQQKQDECEADTVQARIDALRQQKDDEADAVQARIDALRHASQDQDPSQEEDGDDDEDDVQARIAALRCHANGQVLDVADDQPQPTTTIRFDGSGKSVLGAMVGPVPHVSAAAADIPEYPMVNQEHASASGTAVVGCYDPPPPLPVDGDGDEPPAYYPVEDAHYPTGDDTAYPVDDGMAYPVTDVYPTEEDGDYSSYPVPDDDGANQYPDDVVPNDDDVVPDDVIPNENSTVATTNHEDAAAAVVAAAPKVVQVDKELVGFVPSNLRKRNNTTKKKSLVHAPSKAAAPTTTEVTTEEPAKKSIGDDYENFMKEISSL